MDTNSRIIEYIKLTNDPNYILNSDHITFINNIIIDKYNIDIALKLYANLFKNPNYLNIINTPDFSNILNDLSNGSVISLVNIFCSNYYNQYELALDLIHKYNIHKTSSYIPIFQHLIRTRNYETLKTFFLNYIDHNILIIRNNRDIKEFNYNIQFHNQKIKKINNKLREIEVLNNDVKNDQLLCLQNIKLEEAQIKIETNPIIIFDPILEHIIKYVISKNDSDFLTIIVNNLTNPSDSIVDLIKSYDNNIIINQDIIHDDIRFKIMDRIKNKILSMKIKIDKKWNDFIKILEENEYFIIIDGANIGYMNGNMDLNLIHATIVNILNTFQKNILVIIHEKYYKKFTKLSWLVHHVEYIKVFKTPFNLNDDWFWLYASLYCKTYILTNDKSRDHGYMVSYQLELNQWMAKYQIMTNVKPHYLNVTFR